MPVSYRAAQALIKRGDENALRAALDQDLDPNLVNENGWSLLMLAAVEGAVPLGRLLLEHGANPGLRNHRDEDALSIAENRGYALFADLLREGSASSSPTGATS